MTNRIVQALAPVWSMVILLMASSAFGADVPHQARPPEKSIGVDPALPDPYKTPSAKKFSKVIGWPEGKTPAAPDGFKVERFAGDLKNPRWTYVLPDGSVLAAESDTEKPKSANRLTRLVDADGNGVAEGREVFLDGLNQPLGMLVLGDWFYVANTNGLLRYPYKRGQAKIDAKAEKVLDLPADGYNNHWTRNVIASPDGKKLHITVGSATNVDEDLDQDAKDPRRASILQCNPDGSEMRVFASGLRNPCGMDWEPSTKALWTVVNERDELGDNLVPDYLTSVKEGAFYGWPYSYFGQHVDPRHKGQRPELVAKAVKPDYALGSHTASLGLVFYTADAFPQKYRGGAFIGQHGSWNRSTFTGYRVLFVPFKEGKPAGEAEDFLTGFIANAEKNEVYGRPVGVSLLPDGSLLVADDAGNCLWRVSPSDAAK